MRHDDPPPPETVLRSAYEAYAQLACIPMDYGWLAWCNTARLKKELTSPHIPTLIEQLSDLRCAMEAYWEFEVGMKAKQAHATLTGIRESLHHHGWKTAQQIADELNLSKPHIQRILQGLVKEGEVYQRSYYTHSRAALYAWAADYPDYDNDSD